MFISVSGNASLWIHSMHFASQLLMSVVINGTIKQCTLGCFSRQYFGVYIHMYLWIAKQHDLHNELHDKISCYFRQRGSFWHAWVFLACVYIQTIIKSSACELPVISAYLWSHRCDDETSRIHTCELDEQCFSYFFLPFSL